MNINNIQYCIIYSTCPNENNSSELISKQLIKLKLAACVTIIDNVTSIYTWENKLEHSNEKLLIIKTKLSLFEAVKEKIIDLHPYTCPEIIAIPIIDGEQMYLNWLNKST